jgi:D-glycero-D-manno-heptose 1,7-bisphosphate phosphatase
VPYVGDSLSDLQAARAAGARPVLVRTGNGRRTETEHGLDDALVFDDLAGFASHWIDRDQRPQTA